MMNREITFDRFVRGLLVLALIAIAYLLFRRLSGVLLPFLIAWLVAYLIHPLVSFVQYRMRFKSRVLSILSVMLFVLVVLAALTLVVIPPMVNEFVTLKNVVTNYLAAPTGASSIPDTINRFIREHINTREVQQMLSTENLTSLVKGAVPQVWNVLSQSLKVIVGIVTSFIVLLYLFFILKDYESIARGWIGLVPQKYRPQVQAVAHDVEDGMNRYFRGQALIALCVGIGFAIGFSIIDFPMAIGFGLFVGLLNLVPYLQIVSVVPAALLALVKAANTDQNFWWIVVSVIIVYTVVQLIQDMYLTPKIMGKVTGLNPAIILLSLSIWGSLLGLAGMIVALPLTSLLLSYYRRYLLSESRKKPVKKEKSAKS